MEENPLLDQILLSAKKQKRKANIQLLLMLASFACAVILFFQLKNTNAALEIAKTEATESKDNFEKYSKLKEEEIKHLSMLLDSCKNRIGKTDTLSRSINKAITPSKYSNNLVYIQIRGTQESPTAKALLKDLNNKGFSAPGIQRIDRKFKNRVIYFNDQDRAAAEDVLGFLKAALSQNGQQIPGGLIIQKSVVEAPKGQVEVWLNLTD